MATLRGLLVVVLFDLLGELAARGLHLPLPGPVVGMLLLLLAMSLRPALAASCEAGAGLLLRHMSLLFIPAAVAALTSLALLRVEGVRIVVVLVTSTTLALLGAGWAFVFAARKSGR